MQPLRSIKNQYVGVNAHLHSLWQSEGGWDEFHAGHIVYLANALKVPVPIKTLTLDAALAEIEAWRTHE